MNRLVIGALVILAVAGMAGATTVTCPAPNPGAPMNAVGLAAYCGGITFSNFQVMPFGNDKAARVYLGSMNVADKWMSLAFNPGGQRLHLLGEAGGNAADEADGSDRAVRRAACSAVASTSGQQAELCPDSSLLSNLIAVSSTPGSNQAEQKASSTARGRWALGDKSGSPDSLTPGGGDSSSVPEPFQGSDVPEPAAFLLAGPALLGLLALRRKR